MAIRKRLYHPDEVRAKIQTSQIVNRLNDYVFGKIELTKGQVSAALGLLNKVIPNLASVEVSGEIEHKYAVEVPAPAASVESWSQQQTPRLQ